MELLALAGRQFATHCRPLHASVTCFVLIFLVSEPSGRERSEAQYDLPGTADRVRARVRARVLVPQNSARNIIPGIFFLVFPRIKIPSSALLASSTARKSSPSVLAYVYVVCERNMIRS